jgi:hypothetical protein
MKRCPSARSTSPGATVGATDPTSTKAFTRRGNRIDVARATPPPQLWPATTADSTSRLSSSPIRAAAFSWNPTARPPVRP